MLNHLFIWQNIVKEFQRVALKRMKVIKRQCHILGYYYKRLKGYHKVLIIPGGAQALIRTNRPFLVMFPSTCFYNIGLQNVVFIKKIYIYKLKNIYLDKNRNESSEIYLYNIIYSFIIMLRTYLCGMVAEHIIVCLLILY